MPLLAMSSGTAGAPSTRDAETSPSLPSATQQTPIPPRRRSIFQKASAALSQSLRSLRRKQRAARSTASGSPTFSSTSSMTAFDESMSYSSSVSSPPSMTSAQSLMMLFPSDSQLDKQMDNEQLTSKMFAEMAGLKILAATDEEDDYIQWSVQRQEQSATGSTSGNTYYGESETSAASLKTPPRIDAAFFMPPEDVNVKDSPLARKYSFSSSYLVAPQAPISFLPLETIPSEELMTDLAMIPTNRSMSCLSLSPMPLSPSPSPPRRHHTRGHTRSVSETHGPSVILPPGSLHSASRRGRFMITREEVDSSHWRPRRITGPSRFQVVEKEDDMVKSPNDI